MNANRAAEGASLHSSAALFLHSDCPLKEELERVYRAQAAHEHRLNADLIWRNAFDDIKHAEIGIAHRQDI